MIGDIFGHVLESVKSELVPDGLKSNASLDDVRKISGQTSALGRE